MSRVALCVAVLAALPLLAACGGHKSSGVFSVTKGMSRAQVIAIAGKPYRRGGAVGPNCWFYRASKKGTSIDGMRFCFKAGRVSKVQFAVHGAAQTRNGSVANAAIGRVRSSSVGGEFARAFPATVGSTRCVIHGGGPPPGLRIKGTCSTGVISPLGYSGHSIVFFTERWPWREFHKAGSPKGIQQHSWRFTVLASGKVVRGASSGDFPPQLVF
jgi:hypothetical protein